MICEDFLKYMDNFKPFLLAGLRNIAEYQVCHAAVGLVGDLARSLQARITAYSKDIMEVLFEDLAVSITGVFNTVTTIITTAGCLTPSISTNCYNINVR